MYTHRIPRKAFTLVEVLFAASIAVFASLAILGGLYYVNRAQKYARERTSAQTLAATLMEDARRKTFNQLTTVKDQTVTIDDNRTVTTADDLQGKASLLVHRASDGVELANASGEDFVYVEAVITWYSAGGKKTAGSERKVTLVSQFAP